MGEHGKGAAMRAVVTFRVGTQEFCIDVMAVREIRVWTPATPVAHAPDFVCGVIDLRGVVLPIIDLAARLGGLPTAATTRHAILVTEASGQLAGLLVEDVSELLTVGEDLIQPTPDVASEQARRLVSGIIVIGGRMVSLLAVGAILPRATAPIAA